MAEIKYTKKGQKIAVVGKLNATETIVQEIFVTQDGAEVPAGEQFVVTGPLLDKPAETWHDKHQREMQVNYERLSRDIDKLRIQLQQEQLYAGAQIAALRKIAKGVPPSVLKTLEMFVNGKCKYVVVGSEYGHSVEIRRFVAALKGRGDTYDAPLRLLSLYGKAGGELNWYIGDYSDASGGHSKIIPARTIKEAVAVAQKVFDALVIAWRKNVEDGKAMSPPSLEFLGPKEYNRLLAMPDDVREFWRERNAKTKRDIIAELEKKLAKARADEEKTVEDF